MILENEDAVDVVIQHTQDFVAYHLYRMREDLMMSGAMSYPGTHGSEFQLKIAITVQ